MHDPMTLAFSIRNPFIAQKPLLAGDKPYHPPLIDIWHVDPEKDGSDDSCDWFGRRRPLDERERALERALDDLFHRLGNAPYYPDDALWGDPTAEGDEMPLRHGRAAVAQRAMYQWRRHHGLRWHPRWHVHHWRIKVIPLLHFKRWMWTRCEACDGPFRWGEAPVSNSWGGGGLRWFQGERGMRHMRCARVAVAAEESKSAD